MNNILKANIKKAILEWNDGITNIEIKRYNGIINAWAIRYSVAGYDGWEAMYNGDWPAGRKVVGMQYDDAIWSPFRWTDTIKLD